MSLTEPGAIHWLVPHGEALAHPHLVIECTGTDVVACALTSNLHRAKWPGNVLLEPGEGGLARQSVVQAAHLRTVPASSLGERLGTLSPSRVEEVRRGVRFLDALRVRG